MVSIVVPCLQEVGRIEGCLDSILAGDYPMDRVEILVVDGMSTDGTRETVARYAAADGRIRLLDNPKRITPAALNEGIRAARGEVVAIMHAHSVYPGDYVSKLVGWLLSSGADNVGAAWVTRPADGSPKARAIAVGLAHPFGVGNAYFRLGTAEPRWVDTVPYGCYRREIFDRIGFFDEDLVRTEDDEFNMRLIKRGGRVLLVPDVVSFYYARDTLLKLWRMYYQYGYFKVLAATKLRAVRTLRQVVPALFLLGLLVTGGLCVRFPWARIAFAALLSAYAALTVAVSAASAVRHGLFCALNLCAVFPALHVSYGVGFLKGIVDFVVLGRMRAKAVPITR